MLLNELTPRERQVLDLIAEGFSNRAIGDQLYIAPKTLERHICHIFSKLDVNSADAGCNPRVCAVLTWWRSTRAVAR